MTINTKLLQTEQLMMKQRSLARSRDQSSQICSLSQDSIFEPHLTKFVQGLQRIQMIELENIDFSTLKHPTITVRKPVEQQNQDPFETALEDSSKQGSIHEKIKDLWVKKYSKSKEQHISPKNQKSVNSSAYFSAHRYHWQPATYIRLQREKGSYDRMTSHQTLIPNFSVEDLKPKYKVIDKHNKSQGILEKPAKEKEPKQQITPKEVGPMFKVEPKPKAKPKKIIVIDKSRRNIQKPKQERTQQPQAAQQFVSPTDTYSEHIPSPSSKRSSSPKRYPQSKRSTSPKRQSPIREQSPKNLQQRDLMQGNLLNADDQPIKIKVDLKRFVKQNQQVSPRSKSPQVKQARKVDFDVMMINLNVFQK